jgi:hypothetical protein
MHETVKANVFAHIVLSWLIFSSMFWIAAYHKPFHVDEFYSWVYTERSSFQEILRLKEFGIGHPPLFHLVQKAVQSAAPEYHPLIVRLANYCIGSASLAALAAMLSRNGKMSIFYYGVCSSAAFLDTFVFSRMWGLVCFFSILLIWFGEKYIKEASPALFWTLLGVFIMGIFSDYSFILLSPYFVMVISSRTRYLRHVIYVMLVALCALWVFSSYTAAHLRDYGNGSVLYSLLQDLLGIIYETAIMLLRFWFQEPLLTALAVIAISLWVSLKAGIISVGKNDRLPSLVMMEFIILVLLEIMIKNDMVRLRYAAALMVVTGVILFFHIRKNYVIEITSDNSRLVASAACALLIVLSVSPLFWKDLIHFLYVVPLLPVILLLVRRNYGYITLAAISFVFFISGLLYVSSNVIAGYYPPPSFEKLSPVIFKDEFAYSNHYLSAANRTSTKPFFIDSQFDKFCKTCRMGTNQIPFDEFAKLWVVDKVDSKSHTFIPSQFTLMENNEVGLTRSDKYQFEHFHPLATWRYAIFEYRRAGTT